MTANAAKVNPLRADPTRTGLLRKKFEADMQRRWDRLRASLTALVGDSNAFGLTANAAADFSALPSPRQLEAFRAWFLSQLAQSVLQQNVQGEWWFNAYIAEAYLRGLSRAFDDVKHPALAKSLDFYAGTRKQFLQSAFGRPVAIRKVQLMAARTFSDLNGVTEAASSEINRQLVDGMIRGLSPRDVARSISNSVEGITKKRALVIARSEVIRAHAEGNLDAFEALGVTEIGAAVEYSTSGLGRTKRGYPSPCPRCAALKGIVLKPEEAHGMIPVHPNCMCSWIPANVGEPTDGQLKTKKRIESALLKSARLALGKKGAKLSDSEVRKASSWAGAKARITAERPKSILDD